MPLRYRQQSFSLTRIFSMTRSRLLLVFSLFILAIAGWIFVKPLLPLRPPAETVLRAFGAQSTTLANGLQVIVIPNTKVPAVSHMVWYKAGAQDEQWGTSGIAHFLEHLMFKGTPKYGAGEFSKRIAKAGGNDNAFTSTDYTAYFQNISRDKLELVMDLESDRMQNLILDEKEVLKERDVILEERSARIDNDPSELLKEQMRTALFLNHPYGRPLIGWRHEMKNLTVADARAWHDAYYTPNNAVLVVSGDITMEELLPLAEKYYGVIPSRPAPSRHHITEPEPIAPRFITFSDPKVTRPEWSRYYLAPGMNSKDKELCFPLILLSYLLADADTSRMYQRLVVEEQVASGVGSYYEELTLGPSVFVLSAVPSQTTSLDTLEQKMDEQIRRIQTDGVTEEELTRAKNTLAAQTIYAREDLKTLAYLYGQMAATGAPLDYADRWEEYLRAVTPQQVKDAAIAILQPERSVTGRLLPKTIPPVVATPSNPIP